MDIQIENKESSKDFGSIDIITTSIPVNKASPEKKQDSLTQIEYSFSESNSVPGSLTQIQLQSQSEQQQSALQIQTESASQSLDGEQRISTSQNYYNNSFAPKNTQISSLKNPLFTNFSTTTTSEERKQISNSQKISHHTSHNTHKLPSQSTSQYYNSYHTQHKKLQGVSVPNRIFPLNNLISSSQKLQSSTTSISSQQPQQKSAKVLRLLKKDLTSFHSMVDSISTATSIPNINHNLDANNLDEETNEPNKMYESNQVHIDENDSLETKIHTWLDNMDIHITCPSSKMHDYFDNVRQNTFWDIQSRIISGDDLDCYPTPGSQSSFNHLNQITESPNPFTPTPLIERRIQGQLTTLLPTCNFLNRRRLTQKLDDKKPKEIEEVRDEWDQD